MILRKLLVGAALVWSLGTSPVRAQDTSPYRMVIQSVDSTDFPDIEVRFQVFLQDLREEAWDPHDPANKLAVTEWVKPKLGDEIGKAIEPDTIGDIEICQEQPVIMSVAIDVSGSVGGVIDDIKKGVEDLFDRMQQYADSNPDRKRDFGGVFAFASDTSFRYPDVDAPVDQSFTFELEDLGEVVKEIPAGGASPIWISMEEELDRTLAFKADETDYKRVLATLTDGQNNQYAEALDTLLQKAQLGGAQLFNLGYGSPNVPDLQRVADASGGVLIPGAEEDISKALLNLLNSVRTTYCVRYRSPFGNMVNEGATTIIESGSARDAARYPLPFVIPEDSQDVVLFFPVTDWTYQAISGGDPANLPKVEALMILRDDNPDDPQPWVPVSVESPDRPDLLKNVPIDASQTRWIHETGTENERIGFELPVPPIALSLPTDYVDLENATEEEQVISAVQHYLVTATLVYPPDADGQARAGRQYPSATRLSVQDRTPPHIHLKLRPQSGEMLTFTLREGKTVNQDPGFVARHLLTKEAALARGFGDKRAQLEYRWIDPEADEVHEGIAEDQLWSLEEEFSGDPPEPGPDAPEVTLVGVHIPELLRLGIEVLARDNFALLDEATGEDDREVWGIDQLGEREDAPPLHAAFDANREEAQYQDLRPPFLPRQPRSELENNRNLAGVAWWIESNFPDIGLVDNATRFESLPTIRFRASDEEIMHRLAVAGQPVPPEGEPLRWFMIRAQDGQGNTSLVKLPLFVGDVRFQPLLLDWKRRRSEGLD